jgi:hypothetical protein
MYKNSRNTRIWARETPINRNKRGRRGVEILSSQLEPDESNEKSIQNAKIIFDRAERDARARKLKAFEVKRSANAVDKSKKDPALKTSSAQEKRSKTHYCVRCNKNVKVDQLLPSASGAEWRECPNCYNNFRLY